jgi:hypothetical protein
MPRAASNRQYALSDNGIQRRAPGGWHSAARQVRRPSMPVLYAECLVRLREFVGQHELPGRPDS